MINIYQPSLGKEELNAIKEVFESNWLGKGKKTEEFSQLMANKIGVDRGNVETVNSCTEGYDCLVLDNTSKSNNIQDCVFWYRAKPNRNFKIGSKELWKYCQKNYDEKKAKTVEEYDQKKLKKKNTPSVTVKKLKN